MKENFGLYLILTDPIAGYEACAQAAVNCGVRYLQLRMKNSTYAATLETAKKIKAITNGSNTLFIVNDDINIAIESDADGIHLGQDDLFLEQAQSQWNIPGKIFGLSTHSAEQILEAEKKSLSYIGVGPVFPTPTKKNHDPALGIEKTALITKNTPLTSVAIGGINENNLPEILDQGIQNFCVVSAVNSSPNPEEPIKRLQTIWKLKQI